MTDYFWRAPATRAWLEGTGRGANEPSVAISALRKTTVLALRAYLKTWHRFRVEGQQHMPAHGPMVLVANHTSHLDALCLLAALPLERVEHACPAASQEYFFANGLLKGVVRTFLHAIPFAGRGKARRSLGLCRQVLSNSDGVLILFPEGTRSVTGTLGDFRPGIGSLVAGTATAVVPCAIHGAHEAFGKGMRLPRPRGVRLVLGAPRYFGHVAPSRASCHRIAAELHDAVRELQCR